jgi:hypothetical protein
MAKSPTWTPEFARTYAQAIVLLTLVAGCGKQEPWGKVEGTVSFQGKPVETAIVLFSNRAAGVEMTTFTDAEGRFEIHTAKVGGLPVGDYRIAITPYAVGVPTDTIVFAKKSMKTFPNIPIAYRDIATSGLSALVTTGENVFRFDMKPAAK